MPASGRLLNRKSWEEGVKGRLPKHYKDFYRTWQLGPRIHIHSRPNPNSKDTILKMGDESTNIYGFEKDEWGEISPVQNPRIFVFYPKEFHDGLWGGEGVIKGLKAREEARHRSWLLPAPRYFWPQLFEGVAYSQVLDKHIEMVMTKRGVKLVNEASGFDNYLLKTPVNEVYAWNLLKIKREILLKLSDKENFAGGRTDVYDKYKAHSVSHEEADWTGLTLSEAVRKQLVLDSIKREDDKIPLKRVYRNEVLSLLREGQLDDLEADYDSGSKDEGTVSNVLGSIKNVFSKSRK